MRKLIINADDLGISTVVNRKIEECIQRQLITSSSLMANAPAFEDGVRIAKQYPQISIGVHLNILEFTPLTNLHIFQKHGIVDMEGHFIDRAIFCVKIDDELKQAIFEEWDAQISRVEQNGIVPSHCDSHQHSHTIDALQEVLCRVLDKHKITRVRCKSVPSIRLMLRERKQPSVIHLDKSKAMVSPKHNVVYRRFILFIIILKSIRWNREMAAKYTMTNVFYAFRNFYFNKDVIRLGDSNATIELMCHPGHSGFQKETDCMMKDRSWLPQGYKLISYKEIG